MRADRQANGQGVQTTILGWSSLFLAAIESLCAAAVALSGVRVLLGMSSLIAATAAGPAQGFHREALRVPILWASGCSWRCSRCCYCGMKTGSARIPRPSGGSSR